MYQAEDWTVLEKIEGWAVAWGVLLGSVVSFVAPVAPFIGLSVFLILTDLHLGVKAARKKKEAIRSDGFNRTIDKILTYLLLILSAQGVKVVFFDVFEHSYFPFVSDFPITYIVAFLICIREFKSIAENAYDITGVDIWKTISDRIEGVTILFRSKNEEKENIDHNFNNKDNESHN